jgi:hypothetical protein
MNEGNIQQKQNYKEREKKKGKKSVEEEKVTNLQIDFLRSKNDENDLDRHILIRNIRNNGRTDEFIIEVGPQTTIKYIKDTIHARKGVDPDSQCLRRWANRNDFFANELQDTSTISDNGIVDGEVISLEKHRKKVIVKSSGETKKVGKDSDSDEDFFGAMDAALKADGFEVGGRRKRRRKKRKKTRRKTKRRKKKKTRRKKKKTRRKKKKTRRKY